MKYTRFNLGVVNIKKREKKILEYLKEKKHIKRNKFALEAIIWYAKKLGMLENFKINDND